MYYKALILELVLDIIRLPFIDTLKIFATVEIELLKDKKKKKTTQLLYVCFQLCYALFNETIFFF